MAKRGKTSPAEDIMDIVVMLPWWVGVVLALLSYLLLHSVASQQVVASAQLGQVGALVVQTLWKTLAGVGQYILPILCLGGAGMSAWRRRVRQNLVTDVAQNKATDALDGMSWREVLVGEGFRLQGYDVVENGGGGADGIDLVLTKPGKNGGEKFLVQCKQWLDGKSLDISLTLGLFANGSTYLMIGFVSFSAAARKALKQGVVGQH